MLSLSINASNKAGNSVVDLIDEGSLQSTGYIEIRTGTKPETTTTIATGILLATCMFSNPAYGDFSNRVGIANQIASDNDIANNGVAGWYRIFNRDGEAIIDGDVGVTGSGADLEFENINFVTGGTVKIARLDIRMPT